MGARRPRHSDPYRESTCCRSQRLFGVAREACAVHPGRKNGIAQLSTRGALAVGFDHWDTRTGDPNLHTHLVIANKIQGLDGVWRTIDAKGLYAATVAISEIYDVLVADKIAAATGASWSVHHRHERSALFEIDGVAPELLAEFSQRSLQVAATLRELLTDFHARNNRTPNRAEMLRIRQHATRLSRPAKHLRPLPELLARWRDRATRLLPAPIEEWVAQITQPAPGRPTSGPTEPRSVAAASQS